MRPIDINKENLNIDKNYALAIQNLTKVQQRYERIMRTLSAVNGNNEIVFTKSLKLRTRLEDISVLINQITNFRNTTKEV